MNRPGPNPTDPPGDELRDQRIGELINDFFDRRARGESVSAEDFLARHPQYARELREHLGGLDLLAKMGSSGDATAVGPAPRRVAAGSSDADALAFAEGGALPVLPGYQTLKQIGRGGMGVVYKAIQLSTRRVVALKLLLEGPLASESTRRRFEREISLAAQLRHPNITPIYDSGETDGRMYYAMEYIFGLPLGDYVRIHEPDLRAVLKLFIQIGRPVGYAHQRGIIHRDLKPSNILVDGTGDPHVLDFGLAKAGWMGDTTTSISAQIVGTPAYMSPEQAAGDPTGVDTRTDVYSLGVILYELVTGTMPYETNVGMGKLLHNIAHAEPKPPNRVNARVDSELSTIILKALEKHKEDRYQSVDGLIGDVERYLAGEPISVRPATGFYLLRKAVLKHRYVVGGVGVLLAAVVVIAVVIGHFSARIRQKEQSLRQEMAQQQARVEELERQAREAVPPAQTGRMNLAPFNNEWLAFIAGEATRRIAQRKAQLRNARATRDPDPQQIARLETEISQMQERLEEVDWEIKKRSMPNPELAQQFESIITDTMEGMGRPDKAVRAMSRVMAVLLEEAAPAEGDASFKEPDVDVLSDSVPLTSPRPPEYSVRSPTNDQQVQQFLNDLAEAMLRGPADPPAPATQPASTQPTTAAAADPDASDVPPTAEADPVPTGPAPADPAS